MSLYLGLDCSTQSFQAMVLEIDGARRRVVFDYTLVFDRDLPAYRTVHGVLPSKDPRRAVSPPLMWAEALDRVMGQVAAADIDLGRLAAIAGSAQQHGSVYTNGEAAARLGALGPSRALRDALDGVFSRPVAPIWMDTSTSVECREITEAMGGPDRLALLTGSRAFERFTGPQIRRFAMADPPAYMNTARIDMVSSYLASLLLGAPAPLDPGDASGTNLMNLATAGWIPEALEATAPELDRRLPPIVASHAILGHLSSYWQARYRFPRAQVVAWSGDNPCSLVGTGLVREGRLAISLGTSDTVFGLMRAPRVDPSGTGHVFGAPTGDFMGLTCFSNGSLAREAVRDAFDLDWRGFSAALDRTPPGNGGALMLPWFVPEITPAVARPGVERRRLDLSDGPASVRAVVEGQMMSMANHAGWMGVDVDAIYATGGGSANAEILQVMADVFGADVYRSASTNTACLGAALRAFHADRCAAGDPVDWDDVVRGLAEPDAAARIRPRREFAGTYRTLRREYQEFETAALG